MVKKPLAKEDKLARQDELDPSEKRFRRFRWLQFLSLLLILFFGIPVVREFSERMLAGGANCGVPELRAVPLLIVPLVLCLLYSGLTMSERARRRFGRGRGFLAVFFTTLLLGALLGLVSTPTESFRGAGHVIDTGLCDNYLVSSPWQTIGAHLFCGILLMIPALVLEIVWAIAKKQSDRKSVV